MPTHENNQALVRGNIYWCMRETFLFDSRLIDLVHNVEARHVLPVPLDDVDELVNRHVLPHYDVAAVQPVLSQHRLDHVVRQLRL